LFDRLRESVVRVQYKQHSRVVQSYVGQERQVVKTRNVSPRGRCFFHNVQKYFANSKKSLIYNISRIYKNLEIRNNQGIIKM